MSDVDLIAGRESWADGQVLDTISRTIDQEMRLFGKFWRCNINDNTLDILISKWSQMDSDLWMICMVWNSWLRNYAWIYRSELRCLQISQGDSRYTEESMSIEELLIFVLMWFTRHIWVRLPLCRWKSTAMCWYIQIHILGESSDSLFWNEWLCFIIGILRKGVTKLVTGVT